VKPKGGKVQELEFSRTARTIATPGRAVQSLRDHAHRREIKRLGGPKERGSSRFDFTANGEHLATLE